MHICGLRIKGFRSFAEVIDIPFGEGLTALTGENCCGKSSILAAVRWVMGFTDEQANQAIFTSSEAKAPNAEVWLSFAGCKGRLSGPHASLSDMTLSRTLDRSGQDSFHINGYQAGRRDVRVMLGDAGIEIPMLSSRRELAGLTESEPRQRIAVIQAAAGVTGLLARHGAISDKLTQTRRTMKTLDSRIAELSKRFEIAREQEQARRQQQQRQLKIHRLRVRILRARWMQAEEESALARRTLQDVADRCDAHETARQRAFETLGDATGLALAASAEALAALDELADIRTRQAQNEGKRASAQGLIDQLEAESTRLQETITREDSLATEARLLRDHADAGLSALAETGHARIEPLTDTENADGQWNTALEDVRTAGIRLQAAQAALTASVNSQRHNAITAQTSRFMQDKIARIDERIAAISSQDDPSGNHDVHAARSDARQALNQAHGDCDRQRQMCVEADAELTTARKERRALDDALIVQERLVGSLKARIDVLEQLAGADPQSPVDLSWLEPRRQGLEKALLAAVGRDACSSSTDVDQKEHWSGSGGAIGLYLPEESEPLDSLVAAPGHLSKRLAQCGLVSRRDGLRLQNQLHQGQRLVSLEGDMWRWDGFVVRADAETQAQRLDVDALVRTAREDLDAAYAELTRVRAGIQTRSETLVEAEHTADQCAQALGKAMENVAWQREIVLRTEVASSQARLALETRNARLAELEAEKKDALETLAGLTPDPDHGAEVTGVAEALAAAYAEQAVARRTLDTLEQQRKEAVRRRTELTEDKQSWNERTDLATKRLEALRESQNKIVGKIASTRSTLAALDALAKDLARHAATAEETEKKQRSQAKHLREKQQRCANALSSLAEETPPPLKDTEERLESALRREDDIEREIRTQLRCDPAALMASIRDETDQTMSIETAESELAALEAAMAEQTDCSPEDEAIDDVATLENAISEAVREREKTDAAAAHLDTILIQLGKTATERLTRMFEFVDSHFRVLFPALVEGGEGHLELIPDRSPQNYGLDIHIKSGNAAGERPAAQVSENEKVLTALALVLSIFTVRPALFGVLDEVDAGLDTARVQRMCMVLRHIADHTGSRFLLISQNANIASQCNTVLSASMDDSHTTSISRVQTDRSASVVAA